VSSSSGVDLSGLALSKVQLDALRAAFPEVATRFPLESERSLEWLAQEDSWRRGGRDRVSGAQHRLGLLQGTLLKEDFDVGFHSGDGGWRLGAVLVDVVALTLFNAAHGFAEGDRLLTAMVEALRGAFPGAKVVRIHADAFAVLLGPTAEAKFSEGSEATAQSVLTSVGSRWRPAADFTTALLDLTLVSPSHHEVIGPLVWAECERALLLKKRIPATGVVARKVVLDALTPDNR
jgi:GGDEF domain-containing protein